MKAMIVLVMGAAGMLGMWQQPSGTTGSPTSDAKQAAPAAAPTLLDVTAKRIDGTEENLTKYAGKVVLVVNVASKCGLTPQYEALQRVYDQHKDAGLVVLGFPSNDFREQEPGSNKEIAEFCTSKFGVTFPMFEKVGVKGKEAHELYKRLTALPEPLGGEPKWNFTKFLVDRSGKVVARFEPKVKPDSADVQEKIAAALKESVGTPAEKK